MTSKATSFTLGSELHGKRVSVYRNLHKNCWSVVSRSGDDYGRVIAHTMELRLLCAEFKVSESGRQRVLREQKKNVHASVWGFVEVLDFNPLGGERVSYNPYKACRFFDVTTEAPVSTAVLADFRQNGKLYNCGAVRK